MPTPWYSLPRHLTLEFLMLVTTATVILKMEAILRNVGHDLKYYSGATYKTTIGIFLTISELFR
jgi:hypothetical protein